MCDLFNNMKYFSTPPLPEGFQAPTWLKVQLGLIAGRLYFDFDETKELFEFLGLDYEAPVDNDELEAGTNGVHSEKTAEVGRVEASDNEKGSDVVVSSKEVDTKDDSLVSTVGTEKPATYRFTAKPRVFLHDWVSARRKNVDWTHSPVGFVSLGKPLRANHPFFARRDESEAVQKQALAGSGEQDGIEEDDHDDDEFMFPGMGGEQDKVDAVEGDYQFSEDDEDSSGETEESDEEDYQAL
jgi:hypothetical protein